MIAEKFYFYNSKHLAQKQKQQKPEQKMTFFLEVSQTATTIVFAKVQINPSKNGNNTGLTKSVTFNIFIWFLL